jgi:hypothetical protein
MIGLEHRRTGINADPGGVDANGRDDGRPARRKAAGTSGLTSGALGPGRQPAGGENAKASTAETDVQPKIAATAHGTVRRVVTGAQNPGIPRSPLVLALILVVERREASNQPSPSELIGSGGFRVLFIGKIYRTDGGATIEIGPAGQGRAA